MLEWATFIGEVFVFLGSAHKGLKEVREMWKDGLLDHFSVSGSAFLENALSLVYCACIVVAAGFTLAEYVCVWKGGVCLRARASVWVSCVQAPICSGVWTW